MNLLRSFVFQCFFVLLLTSFASPPLNAALNFQEPALSPDAAKHVHRVMLSQGDDLFVILNNGLPLLVHPMPGSRVVSTQIFVRTGSIHEGEYLGSGLSHYLEHVVSGGTTRSFTEDEAMETLERIGGQTNAYTSYDRTVYYINTASQHWQDALHLLLSYVSESTLEPSEILRERSVIQQEMKMGENSPSRELWKLFAKTAYREHPVKKPIIGYEHIFVKKERDALLQYYRERYRPDNMVVVVAGAVNPEEVVKFVGEKTMDFQRRAAPPVALPPEPPQLNVRWQERELPVARLTQAMVGFPSVALHHPDLYALDVLALLLGQGRSSRLYTRLKDEENRVLSVSASNWTPSYTEGQFLISLSLAPQHWPLVLESIQDEIEQLKREPVSHEELEKAKKQVRARHVFGLETAASRASSMASSFHDTGNPYFDTLYLEGISRVTAQQVKKAAHDYLDMNRMNVAAIHPPGANSAIEPDPVVPTTGNLASTEPSLKEMPNGLRVLLKQDTSLPLVTIQLYGLGGLHMEHEKPPGIAAFTSSLLTAGTESRSRRDIARAIEEVGGHIVSRSDNNTYRVSVKVLREDLELALDILADVVQNPIFPEEEIEKLREETLLAIDTLDTNWQTEVLRLFRQNYFDQSPYRKDRLGTPQSIKSITRDEIVNFYGLMVNPKGSVLAVFGDVDPIKTKGLIEERFSGWEGHTLPLPSYGRETANILENQVVEKRNEKSAAALFIGTNGLEIGHESQPVLDVLNMVLSGTGYPGGRLFKGLRGGEEDLVYVVGAFPFYAKDAGFYGILTQTTLRNLDRVQEIILKNLEALREELIPEDELERTKNLLVAMRHLSLESLDARAQSAAVNEVLSLGWDHDKRYVEMVQRVTGEQIRDLARELFGHTLVVRTIPENPVEILEIPPPMSDIHTPG